MMRLVVVFWAVSIAARAEFRVFGYVPDYRIHAIDLDFVLPKLSDAIEFSVKINPDGSLVEEVFPYEGLLLTKASKSNTKVFVCLGGAGRTGLFDSVFASDEKLETLVKELERYVRMRDLSGVDLNYSGSVSRVGKFFSSLRDKLPREENFELSLAMHLEAPDVLEEWRRSVDEYVDTYHVMAYDISLQDESLKGKHSPLELSEFALKLMKRSGFDFSKITLGVPFHARETENMDAMSYDQILGAFLEEGIEFDSSSDTYVKKIGDSELSYWYNNVGLVAKKTRLAWYEKLKGIMVWDVGMDCRPVQVSRGGEIHVQTCESESHSLLHAIHESVLSLNNDEL